MTAVNEKKLPVFKELSLSQHYLNKTLEKPTPRLRYLITFARNFLPDSEFSTELIN